MWKNFYARIGDLVESLAVKEAKEERQPSVPAAEKEVEVTIDGKYYGVMPLLWRLV